MDIFYSQHDIAKLCNETDTAVSRVLVQSSIRPTLTVGLRFLFTEAEKDEVVRLVAEYRRQFPKVCRHKKGSNVA